MSQDLKNRSIIVALLLVAWAAAIYGKAMLPAQVSDLNVFIVQIQVLLGGVVGYHVGAGSAPAAFTYPPAGPSVLGAPAVQGGFVAWSMMWLLLPIALTAALLSGCSTAMRAYESAAAVEIKQADDNALAIWKSAGCIQPVGAVLRDPDVIDAVNRFCGGAKSQLGTNQPITVNVTVPPVPAAAPAK